MHFTIFGGAGFVGGHLADYLRGLGAEVWVPGRADIADDVILERDLGHVIYAIGMTADFRSRLEDTVEAHVDVLRRLLGRTRWQSWLYLSSTRVYGARDDGRLHGEDDPVAVTPGLDSIYDLSKLLGEALCLARPEATCRVARLANVFGPGMPGQQFLAAVAREAATGRKVTIREHPDSGKDYIPVQDVCRLLHLIATQGRNRAYNVASGCSITHAQIAALLSDVFGSAVTFADNGALRRFPGIDTRRIKTEFGASSGTPADEIRHFLDALRTGTEDSP